MNVTNGDRVKCVGNHCYKGKEGVVDRVEDVDGVPYVHASLDNGPKIIMRPGQFEVIQSSGEEAPKPGDKLVRETLTLLRRVRNCHRYSYGVRLKVLLAVQEETVSWGIELDREKEALDHKQEISTLHG
jgi:hypothetical protein